METFRGKLFDTRLFDEYYLGSCVLYETFPIDIYVNSSSRSNKVNDTESLKNKRRGHSNYTGRSTLFTLSYRNSTITK